MGRSLMFARRMLNGAMSKRVQQPFSTMSATASLWAWMEEMVKWLKTGRLRCGPPHTRRELEPVAAEPRRDHDPGQQAVDDEILVAGERVPGECARVAVVTTDAGERVRTCSSPSSPAPSRPRQPGDS